MHITSPPALTFDEIDDLLYFTRTRETANLQQTITELTQKYQCQPRHVLAAALDPDSGNTTLHFCAANGFDDLMTGFLAQLTDENATETQSTAIPQLWNHTNKEGNTPLHWAAYNGHLVIVKQLIAVGADMWIKNTAGHLAMFEAERADKNEVVQYLLEAGGKEVERTGTENAPSAEDLEEVQVGEASSSAMAGGGVDVDMENQTSNG